LSQASKQYALDNKFLSEIVASSTKENERLQEVERIAYLEIARVKELYN